MSIDEITTEVLRLDADATPGPWDEDGIYMGLRHLGKHCSDWYYRDSDGNLITVPLERDAAIIAYYRATAPALAREVQRLQGQIERLHGQGCDCHFDRYRTWRKGYREGQEAMLTRCRDAIGSLPDYPACCTCSHDRRRSRSHSDPHCSGYYADRYCMACGRAFWGEPSDCCPTCSGDVLPDPPRAMEVAHD